MSLQRKEPGLTKQALQLSFPFIVPINPGIQDNCYIMPEQRRPFLSANIPGRFCRALFRATALA